MGVCVYEASWYVVECCENTDTKFSVGGVFVLAPTRMLGENWQHFDTLPTCRRHVADIPGKADRQNDRQRNKYTCCTWAGGTFFPVAVLCQFLVLAGNRFWFYILMYLE
jgi:hypothetical protein